MIGHNNEYFVEDIIDEKKKKGTDLITKYLVRWVGFDQSHDSWEPAKTLEDNEALTRWELSKGMGGEAGERD